MEGHTIRASRFLEEGLKSFPCPPIAHLHIAYLTNPDSYTYNVHVYVYHLINPDSYGAPALCTCKLGLPLGSHRAQHTSYVIHVHVHD